MKQKKFARFDDYLEEFGKTAMKHLQGKGTNETHAYHQALELVEIIRQARWINMRAGIKRAAEELHKN